MKLELADLQNTILEVVEGMVVENHIEFEESIQPNTRLVQDLGFTSINFVELVVLIEERLGDKLGFHGLLMQEGEYIEDLYIYELIKFVQQKFNSEETSKEETFTSAINYKPHSQTINYQGINESKIQEFSTTINSKVSQVLSIEAIGSKPKNSSAIFILCPPRSGSTLLRVILAGHPQIFAPPELHLLSYETLPQRKASLSNELNRHLLQGTIRALMQAYNLSIEEAKTWMETYEIQGMTTQEFYQLLQKAIGDRILVDKTPTYASHLNILQRAEQEFDRAYYIHLVRHPYGMIRSYEDAKLDRIVPFMNTSSFSQRELAELTWVVSNQNILEFFKQVPQHRQFQVKFEDLVHFPEDSIKKICDLIDLNFDPGMLQPYKDKEQRMTDGIETISMMSGDLKFHLHRAIEPDVVDRWKRYHQENFLGEVSCNLAESFGYSINV
ncbi:MAG: sulfotransferase [Microcoleaceae cyanobacterium]